MPAILDSLSENATTRPASGVALICDQAMTASLLAEGEALGADEAEIYAGIAAAILRHTRCAVVLHARTRPDAVQPAVAIAQAAGMLAGAPERLRLITAEPLEALFP